MFSVLSAICCVVIVARVLGALVEKAGQPRVIGEIIAGILLGPSVLGRWFPELEAQLFPQSVIPILTAIADLGIVVYMFLVGLELNIDQLRRKAGPLILISQSSIIVPFIAGAILSVWLYSSYAPATVSRTTFAMFVGVATSITAFPVLARILADRKLTHTELGRLTINCAAFADIVAWALLALVVGLAKADVSDAVRTLLLTIPYLLVMFAVVYPWLHRYFRKDRDASKSAKDAWIWLGMIVSATVTEAIGIHAVFGAFLFGLLIPHDAPVAASLRSRMHDFAAILMVPLFFACTGLKTQFGLLANYQDWLICAAIIVIAVVGKVGGTALGARWANIDWRSSCLVGILMNTRGLMEVIVLNIGLEMGILSPMLFAMFVLMALVTTMGTVPALQWMGQASAFGTPVSTPPDLAVDRL